MNEYFYDTDVEKRKRFRASAMLCVLANMIMESYINIVIKIKKTKQILNAIKHDPVRAYETITLSYRESAVDKVENPFYAYGREEKDHILDDTAALDAYDILLVPPLVTTEFNQYIIELLSFTGSKEKSLKVQKTLEDITSKKDKKGLKLKGGSVFRRKNKIENEIDSSLTFIENSLRDLENLTWEHRQDF